MIFGTVKVSCLRYACIDLLLSLQSMQKCTGEMAKQIIRQVRAVNYSVNSQDFTICICSLESLGECAQILRDSEDLVQVGACISSKPTGVLCTTKI